MLGRRPGRSGLPLVPLFEPRRARGVTMTVDWYAEGVKFGNCNCDYSCPCQFEALPTNRFCQGIEVLRIDQGHFGEVSLNGLAAALLYSWPGAIYEGNGAMQTIIDERADPSQRKALAAILHGEETREGAP